MNGARSHASVGLDTPCQVGFIHHPDGYHPDMTTVADALASDSAFEEHPFDPAAAAQYDTELD